MRGVQDDPYEVPAEVSDFPEPVQRFSGWNTPVLLVIFFVPASFYILAFCSSRYFGNRTLEEVALYLCLASGVVSSFLSASIHSLREEVRPGLFTLLTLVYLLAQILVFMTLRIGAEIVVEVQS